MIFEEQIARKPDLYPFCQKFIEAIQNTFWTVREFNFQSDLQDFKVNLTEQEKEIIVRSLATIGQLEISVKKFWAKIGDNLPHPSINDMGFVFAANEVVHNDSYQRLLEVLGLENSFEDILQLDFIKGRVNYLRKHLHKFHSDNRKQFVYSLILFSIFIENIALFSQFYTINWFGKFKNVLKDTRQQTSYTLLDEGVHFLAGTALINQIRKEHPELFDKELEEKIYFEAEQAVKYECEIVHWIINGYGHETLNSDLVKEFIKNRLNDSLIGIGYSAIFEIDKDLLAKTNWFEELTLGNGFQDFFASKTVEYVKNAQSFTEEDLF